MSCLASMQALQVGPFRVTRPGRFLLADSPALHLCELAECGSLAPAGLLLAWRCGCAAGPTHTRARMLMPVRA